MRAPRGVPQAAPPAKGLPWRGVLIGCGVLAVVGVMITCVGIVVLYKTVQPPDDVAVIVAARPELAVGQEADFVVTVSNQRGDAVRVIDIRVAERYLNWFTVVSTDPKPISRQRFGPLGIQRFVFGTGIPAGSSQVFTFRLRASTAGIHRGRVDVSLGTGRITQVAETVVREQAP
jgi:hypothetical protein